MSADYFITFQPTDGVYKQAIAPYKSWLEGSAMSKEIEIDGDYYRFVITVGLLNKFKFRKILVCDSTGQVIKNEEVTRKCLSIIMYLAFYEVNKQDMKFLLTQGKQEQHEPLIKAFKEVKSELVPLLTPTEKDAMAFHLHYLEEIYGIQYELSKVSRVILTFIEQIRSLQSQTYDNKLLEDYISSITKWSKLKNESEAILHEDGEKARKIVDEIMNNNEYRKIIRRIDNYQFILNDIQGATQTSKRYLKNSKARRVSKGKWLGIYEGPFTVKKLIYELRHVETLQLYNQMDVDQLIHYNWVLSPDCMFK